MPALLRRFLFAPIPRLLWTLILAIALGRLLRWIAPGVMHASNVSVTGATRNAVLTTIIFVAALWLFEHKRPRDAGLGLAGAVSGTARGFLLGALLLTVVTGVIALGGGYQLLGWAPIPEDTTRAALLTRVVVIFLAVGIFEEVTFRGILFRQLEQAIGTWLAIIASALFLASAIAETQAPPGSAASPSPSRPAACSPRPTWRPGRCGCRSGCTGRGTSSRAQCGARPSPDSRSRSWRTRDSPVPVCSPVAHSVQRPASRRCCWAVRWGRGSSSWPFVGGRSLTPAWMWCDQGTPPPSATRAGRTSAGC